jgi:hypothetical protein
MDFYVYYSFEVRGFREEELPSIFNHMKTAIQLSKVATLWFYSPCLKPFYHIVPPLFLFMCAVIFSRHKRLRRFMYYTTFLWRSTPLHPPPPPPSQCLDVYGGLLREAELQRKELSRGLGKLAI